MKTLTGTPTIVDPELTGDLEKLISPDTRGDPQSPLRWTCKSTHKLASELQAMKPGRSVSPSLISRLLRDMDYSLQSNRKTLEGSEHPDRDLFSFQKPGDGPAHRCGQGQSV